MAIKISETGLKMDGEQWKCEKLEKRIKTKIQYLCHSFWRTPPELHYIIGIYITCVIYGNIISGSMNIVYKFLLPTLHCLFILKCEVPLLFFNSIILLALCFSSIVALVHNMLQLKKHLTVISCTQCHLSLSLSL